MSKRKKDEVNLNELIQFGHCLNKLKFNLMINLYCHILCTVLHRDSITTILQALDVSKSKQYVTCVLLETGRRIALAPATLAFALAMDGRRDPTAVAER